MVFKYHFRTDLKGVLTSLELAQNGGLILLPKIMLSVL